MKTRGREVQVVRPLAQGDYAVRSPKIQPRHLEQCAIVYVRQSTPRQVLENQESTRLQYALVERAVQLGWVRENVTVVDEDQGKSGTSAEGRAGFQRLVSEVTLGHVGLILGVEMSRLARSCKDWHQLLEACGLFGSLIADVDGVYDPAAYNDRLLLGLKGTMSEAELHILKQRMYQGKLAKARRGELRFPLPIGYVWFPGGEIEMDPDEEVQDMVRTVFRTFEERGTIHSTLRYLVSHELRLGVRVRGEVEWRRPNRETLQNLLHNPTYAGAYAYGRRQTDPRRKKGGRPATGRVVVRNRDEWHVLLEDHHPAYINWGQYEANLAQLEANRVNATSPGPIRHGSALLSGLVVCARCGGRMNTLHSTRSGPRYAHHRMSSDYGLLGRDCPEVPSASLDPHVVERLLEALEPASLQVSLEAARDISQERVQQRGVHLQRIERARFEAERAERHYALVEPENRLVARKLEAAWESKLRELHQLERNLARFEAKHSHELTELERQAIAHLSEDLPALWHGGHTTVTDRKEILREAIERIVVDVEGRSERVGVTIHWKGDAETLDVCTRSVATYAQLSYYEAMLARMRELLDNGAGLRDVAEALNQEGFRPPKRTNRFNAQMIRGLLPCAGRRSPGVRRQAEIPDRRSDDMTVQELAVELGVTDTRVFGWVQREFVVARAKMDTAARKRWLIRAAPAELRRLRKFVERTPIPRRAVVHKEARSNAVLSSAS